MLKPKIVDLDYSIPFMEHKFHHHMFGNIVQLVQMAHELEEVEDREEREQQGHFPVGGPFNLENCGDAIWKQQFQFVVSSSYAYFCYYLHIFHNNFMP